MRITISNSAWKNSNMIYWGNTLLNSLMTRWAFRNSRIFWIWMMVACHQLHRLFSFWLLLQTVIYSWSFWRLFLLSASKHPSCCSWRTYCSFQQWHLLFKASWQANKAHHPSNLWTFWSEIWITAALMWLCLSRIRIQLHCVYKELKWNCSKQFQRRRRIRYRCRVLTVLENPPHLREPICWIFEIQVIWSI